MVWQRRARMSGARLGCAEEPVPLITRLAEFRAVVNGLAGGLPVRAVVLAHQIGDTVHEAIGVDEERDLDFRTVVLLEKLLTDYLPTSLRSYLAVRAHDSGDADGELLRQLAILREEARRTAQEAVARESDLLRIHGHFLDAKMTGSDLEV